MIICKRRSCLIDGEYTTASRPRDCTLVITAAGLGGTLSEGPTYWGPTAFRGLGRTLAPEDQKREHMVVVYDLHALPHAWSA